MFITGAMPAVAVIGGAIVVVAAAAGTIRVLRSNRSPMTPASGVTIQAASAEAGHEAESGGRNWPSIREGIVHGDPFTSKAIDPSTCAITFENEVGVDAVDVLFDFRDFRDRFEVEGARYRFERMANGVAANIPIKDGAAVQGRIPLWITYSIDGDPAAERHTIDLSVLAHGA